MNLIMRMRGGEYVKKIDPLVFGAWVREKRKFARLTQEELAKAAGITRFQLIRIENGESKTTRETASAIADALREDEGEALRLAGYDGEPLPSYDIRLARRLEPLMMQVPADRRSAIEDAIEHVARAMVGASTA